MFKKLYSNLKLIIFKKYSFSTWSIIKFFLLFISHFLFFYLPLYASIRFTLQSETKFTSTQWWAPILLALILVVLNYIWNNIRDKNKNKKIESDKIIYDCIGGAIQELHELEIQDNDGEHFINEILVYIEKVIEVMLNSAGIEKGTLCVNYMVKDNDNLVLTNFATKFQNRNKPMIPLNIQDPLPGAPEAWVLKKVIYINDIENEKFNPYFKESFNFKSFISIPVFDDNKIYGIINVDSNLRDQFVSNEFITKRIMTKIGPFLSLFIFKVELFSKREETKNGNNGSK